MARPGEAVDQRIRSIDASTVALTIKVDDELRGQTVSDLRDEILRAVDRGVVAITVDLSDVPRLPVEARSMLARAGEMMHNRGAVLVVVARDAGGQSLVASGPGAGARLAAAVPAGRDEEGPAPPGVEPPRR